MRECTTKQMRDQSPVKLKVVNMETGDIEEQNINLDVLINRFEDITERYMKIGKYKVLGEFFHDIIWTFRVTTAATDGIRIYFNPLFANELMAKCAPAAKAKRDELVKKGIDVRDKRNGFDMIFESSKCFLLVLIHECYHQLYRHIESELHKDETRNAPPSIHDLANVCQDIEINRDIEIQFPEFAGCTVLSNGQWEAEKYPVEIWSEIFDDKYKNGETVMPPPVQAQPPGQDGDQPGEDDNRHMMAPDDYKRGWDQAIADIKAGKITPGNFKPLAVNPENFDHEVLQHYLGESKKQQISRRLLEFNRDEYNQGYNDCIQTYLNSLNGGGGKGPKGPSFDNLEQPPMKGGGDGEGDSGDDQKQGDQQQQGSGSGSGQSGDDQQNQQGQQQSGSGSGGASDQQIDNMSGKEAADSAQQSAQDAQTAATEAQNAANQAQQKASQSGSASDQAKADAAQQAANQAQSAANAAQKAAQDARSAAGSGDEQTARDKAKQARDAANQAKSAAKNAGSQSGQGGQQGQQGQQQGQGNKGQDQSKHSDRSQSQDGTEKGSKNNIAGNLGDQAVNVNVGDRWGGSDIISKEDGMAISEAEGEPFTTDEINQTPEQHAKAVINKNEKAIKDIGKGTSMPMDRKLARINEILSPSVVNWKNLLAKLFKNAGVKEEEQFKMKKSRMGGGFSRADRYEKVNPRNDILPSKNSADVFYLIDNSGSISERDLYRTFSEVLALECRKDMNIRKSALTYFSDDIDESKIRVWYKEDSKKKKMELMEQNGDVCGGTQIAKSVVHVTQLKKQFYSRNNPRTLIIVFTDAVDYDWKGIEQLPEDIKRRLIFIVLNGPGSGWGFDTVIPNILNAGISDKNIVPIDVTQDLKD